MLFVVLCPGTPKGSTSSGSGFKASQKTGQRLKVSSDRLGEAKNRTSQISRTDKVELIATEFFQQSCDCLGYLEQHTKSCKSYLVGKYLYFRLKNDHFYA